MLNLIKAMVLSRVPLGGHKWDNNSTDLTIIHPSSYPNLGMKYERCETTKDEIVRIRFGLYHTQDRIGSMLL